MIIPILIWSFNILILIVNFITEFIAWPFFLNHIIVTLCIFGTLYFYFSLYSQKVSAEHLNQMSIDKINKINFELSMKLQYLEENCNEIKHFKDSHGEIMKTNVIELTNKMMSHILDFNKTEQEKIRQSASHQIQDANTNFKQHFSDVLEKISFITKDFHESKQAIEIINKNIFNPIGAGKLTEISLENILRKSGLIEGIDFFIQKHIATSSGDSDSSNIRPDALVILPNNHLIVIDAKACKLNEVEDKKLQENFRRNILNHLKSLASKRYDIKADQLDLGTINLKLKSNDTGFKKITILMFMVSEEMVSSILFNQDILDKCIEHNITPVGPSSMLNILSMYKLYIHSHKKEENLDVIIKKLEELIEYIGKAGCLVQSMTSNIASFNQNYEKFTKVFNDKIIAKANDITELGVHVKNKLK